MILDKVKNIDTFELQLHTVFSELKYCE